MIDVTERLRRIADAARRKDGTDSPLGEDLRSAADEIECLRRARDDHRARKETAYEESNRIVAALARVFPSGTKKTAIPGWDAEWHNCVYIDTPAGQLSWHYHDSQAHLFADLPPYSGEWDGHDTPEKYRRLEKVRAPDEIERLRVAVASAADWFADYANRHFAKGDLEKADRNRLREMAMRYALEDRAP
ncbi:MAG: hypothetical protein ACK50Q_11055 [Labrys sp. (in: a-proteobacteria)]